MRTQYTADRLPPQEPPAKGRQSLRVIMLGDIVGTPGRQAVAQLLPDLRQRWQPDLVIANGENAANGSGLTNQLYKKIINSGVDAITLGDHVYRKVQITATLETEDNIIRPANLSASAIGKRWMKLTTGDDESSPAGPNVYVTTMLGRIYTAMPCDDPFACVDGVIKQLPEMNPIVIVEIHAEATSEKQAMGYHLDGRVSAVIGSHTHVQTADECILPGGTAYITDMGMCGPHASVIGRRSDRVLTHMTTAMPAPFDVATGDPRLNGVVIDIDRDSHKATAIHRLNVPADENKPPFVMA